MRERVIKPISVTRALALALLVFLSACDRDSSTPLGDSTPPDDGTAGLDDPIVAPDSPANIRGVVYTEIEIELFWDRSDDSTDVVAYQIWRDGVLLDTRDGLSFYQNELIPATT